MFLNDNGTKKTLRCRAIGVFLMSTLLIYFSPLFMSQLGWPGSASIAAVADSEGGNGENTSGVPYHSPPNAQVSAKPRSMIVMSNDHQLFFKAYTDYSNIDDEDGIETTYKSSISYYGYFDSSSCYEYDPELAGGAFKVASEAGNDYTCSGNKYWSGNFLNWVSMTRMDILRKVLYGGKRYRDDASRTTILERAYLPYDAHSFTKIIISSGNVINKNTPFNGAQSLSFCSTTGHSGGGKSKDVTEPPLLRVAEGKWPNWAANERWQCTWRNESGRGSGDQNKRPSKQSIKNESAEYRVLVEACKQTTEGCKRYPDSEYAKPTGLLHEYADGIDFALLSGSYDENTRGGVLRSNMRDFNDEINPRTGVFNGEQGIVSNVNAFRVSRYNYSDGTYNSDNCAFGKRLSQVGQGACSSWGNPFAEMVEEALNYLTGGRQTPEFSVGTGGSVESDYVMGLSSPDWDYDNEESWCAAHTMILMNSSETSFDSDQLDKIELRDGSSVKSWTNKVAQQEAISGEYFVGQAGGVNDRLCTAKTVGFGNFGNIKGVCPGAPGLEGSYNVAGLAKYAHDTPIVRSADDSQGSTVDTYAVRLTTNTPIIDLGKVKIVPACENVNDDSKCAIVDFRPEYIDDNSGKFDITWEVAEFGGDYDSDIEMTFEYFLSDSRLTINTDVLSQSSSRKTGVGYILSGTSGRYRTPESNEIVSQSSDGFNVHSGINGYSGSLCNNCRYYDGETSQSYRVSPGASAATLKPPLYYAAKYGNDIGTGAYFEVSRIDKLVDALRDVFEQVSTSERTGAGLGESRNVDNRDFQTTYKYEDFDGWSGDLIARESSPSNDGNLIWRASNKLPEASQRTIITTYRGRKIPFQPLYFLFSFNFRLFTAVPYMRGMPLGDMIDSKPKVVGKPDSYYVPSQAEDDSYLDFIADHEDRKPMVYVGANDGMLHGFDANTGIEELAYVPGLLLDYVDELADLDYKHRFYVDGSPEVSDARWNGTWHSVLASGLGAGGAGLFALDVTDPDAFSEANAGRIALFEYGPSDEQDLCDRDCGPSNLGYIYGPPSIVQLENGKHAIVFGNGYFSDSGKAVLYIIYLDGAADGSIAKSDVIRLVASDDVSTGVNGLSTASLEDLDKNGRMDTAYAGDLQGNLWRFDLSSEDDGNWQGSIARLFTTRQHADESNEDAFPVITTGVAVGRHPKQGIKVFFGTGSAPNRRIPTSQDRGAIDAFYSVDDVISQNQGSVALPLTRDQLRRRNLQEDGLYFSNQGKIDNEKGWYMDFSSSERVVDTPRLEGEEITFSTLIPGFGFCGVEDEGLSYKFNAFSGASFNYPVLDINGDGKITSEDVVIIGGERVVPVAIKTQGSFFTQTPAGKTANTNAERVAFPQLAKPLGQVSWRELEN